MISSFIDSCREKRVLVLGDVFIDEYILGDCSRLSPEAPVPVLEVQYSYTVPGGAANTAANIASLGGKATLIGMVGNDKDAALFKKRVKEQHVQFIPVISDHPTIKKSRILGQKQQLLRIDYEEIQQISFETEEEIFLAFREKLAEANVVVLSDYTKGFFTRSLCQKIIREAHKTGKKVVIDPKPGNAAYYKNCDYLTPNWKESLQMAGLNGKHLTYEAAEEVAGEIRNLYKSSVLLTLGPKGVFFQSKNGSESFYLPTESREVFDVSGAGDTVVAVFALGIASGGNHMESVRLANKAAGAVVAKMGTAMVTPEDLYDFLDQDLKLVSRSELNRLSTTLKSQGKRIVTVNGSFDLLHHGHLHILKEGRAQGDVLIVGLNSDASIKKLKGKDRPLVKEKYRAEMLLALEHVDYVHIFPEEVPMPFLEKIQPDVHVNGSEYGKDCIESGTVKAHGGRIHVVDKIRGFSTSSLLKKIVRAYGKKV